MTNVGEIKETTEGAVPRWATVTFLTLFAMNLLDYTDRWVLSAVLPQIQTDLKIDNTQGGMLSAWFLVSYTLISPLMGYAGDRMKRTWLLALGVGVWSVATLGSGFSQNYNQLRISRAFLGIGEATYGVIAPTILMDLYSREWRSRVMSWFYLAMPIGGAIGMGLGGWIGKHYGWHAAFFVVGAPGLVAAFTALLLPEPLRGLSEGVDPERVKAHERAGARREDYIDLMVNSSYTYSVLGMAFYTFAIGGLAYWMPKFLIGTKGIEQEIATRNLAVVTLFASIIGMSLGAMLADRLAKTNPRALFLVPGFALVASVPFLILAIYSKAPVWLYGGVFMAEALMFINTGPCNAVIANVVMPNMRSAAFAVSIFAVHALGDIWSPSLMGWVADNFGDRDAMDSVFGRMLAAIGATPTVTAGQSPENFTAGMLVVVPAVLLAGFVLLAGARHLPREMALMLAKLKASPRQASGTGAASAAR